MWCEIAAGWMSGMIGFAVGHPLDTIKVTQQIQNIRAIQATSYVYRVGGIRGFYRGISFPVFANGIVNAVFFGVYGTVLDHLTHSRLGAEKGIKVKDTAAVRDKPMHRDAYFKANGMAIGLQSPLVKSEHVDSEYNDMILSGSIAGVAQIAIAGPVDRIKVQLQKSVAMQKSVGAADICKRIYKRGGLTGFYRGVHAMIIRNVVGAALRFTFLYHVLQYITEPKNFKHRDLDFWLEVLPAAGCSGMVAWWFVMPFDVIKSKMQADNPQSPKYKNIWVCGKDIYRRHKIRGFYKGVVLTSCRNFPVSASAFTAYNFFLGEFKAIRDEMESDKND